MAKQWRLGIVGTGMIGQMHVGLIGKISNLSLVALCDAAPERAQAAAARAGRTDLAIHSDLQQMLDKEHLDVVTVCTPSGLHMDPVLTILNAGVNCICEKPMEIQLDRIDRMVETAAANKVRLAGIFQNRWNDANRAIHDAAAAGRFGRLAWGSCFTPWFRNDKYYADAGWRGTWKYDGGGAIMNQSVHAVDLLQWICGPVKRVSAYSASLIHPQIEVEDTLSCSLEFESGAFGTIMGSTAMWPGGPVRIWVGGEKGTAISENGLRQFKFAEERPEDAELVQRLNPDAAKGTGGGANPTDLKTELHQRNIRAILEAWEAGQDAETSGVEARKSVAIILAMYESARRKGASVDVA